MARASARSWSNSGRFASAVSRFATKPRLTLTSAFCNAGFASARAAASLKSCVVSAISALRPGRGDRRLINHAGQHLGDMTDLDVRVLPREPARDLQQAAEIAGHHSARAGPRDVVELGV